VDTKGLKQATHQSLTTQQICIKGSKELFEVAVFGGQHAQNQRLQLIVKCRTRHGSNV
jgi:hypothetical protein